MNLTEALAELQDIQLDRFPEGVLRRQVSLSLSVIELLGGEVQRQGLLIEQQGDEIRRLKELSPRPPGAQGTSGGRGRGLIAPVPEKDAENPDLSSEKERKTPRERKPKEKKLESLEIHEQVRLEQFATPLPGDAEFKGWQSFVGQDLRLTVHNTEFLRAKYYSRSTGKTYLAVLPPGYQGHYAPGLASVALSLSHGCQVTQKLLHEWLTQAGVQIARSTLQCLLAGKREGFAAELREVYQAGLDAADWVATDTTETQMDGEKRACHVVGNQDFTFYCTLMNRDRRSVLSALQGGEAVQYRLDEASFGELDFLRVSQAARQALSALPNDETWTEAEFVPLLDRVLPERSETQHKRILDAAALAAYWNQTRYPVVPVLLTDDASTYRGIALQALCWIHELRHYKKLAPCLRCHREELDRVLTAAWEFYWELLEYQKNPRPEEAIRLRQRFTEIFGATAAWGALSERLALTHQKMPELLCVLKHPEVPLHNNGSELAARQRVRKRDVSLQPRSEEGLADWDLFQSLRETTRKLGISFTVYLRDRISQAWEVPRLADVIRRRATERQPPAALAPG